MRFVKNNNYIYIYCFIVFVLLVFGCIKCVKAYKKIKLIAEYERQTTIKLSLKDDIFRIDNVKFYVPNYPLDGIQREIVDTATFYEINELKKIDDILPDNPVILDIGANIGNHTLYWALKSPKKAKHIYAFEIIDETYDILKKNIEINHLQNRVTAFNFGLSNVNSSAKVKELSDSFQSCCAIMEEGDGGYKFKKLDDVKINEKVDFVKIDVEGQEIKVVEGAKQFLSKHKPLIWVEVWSDNYRDDSKGNRSKYDALMKELGYEQIMEIGFYGQTGGDISNFVYQHKSKIEKK